MDSNHLSKYKNISIILMALWVPCWLYDDLMIKLGISVEIGRLLGVINLLGIAVYFGMVPKLDKTQKTLIFLYGVMIYYLVFLMFVYWGTGYSTVGEISRVITGILFFMLLNDARFDFKSFINIFIYFGFFFALLSVIAFLDKFSGINMISYSSSSHRDMAWFSFFGYTGGVYQIGNIMRVQSFWSEPARFAQFLIFPLSLIYTKYLSTKNRKHLFMMLVMLVALLTTFSVAVLSALTLVFIIYFAFRKVRGTSVSQTIYRRLAYLTMSAGLIVSVYYLYQYTNNESGKTNVMGKETDVAFVDRFERFNIALSVLETSSFGDRSFTKKFGSNPTVYGTALIYGGIPYLVIALLYSMVFYIPLLKRVWRSQYKFIFLGSLAYFIAFSWYGLFTENFYFFQMALLTTIINYEQNDKQFI
ncbi:MAG: hypothetical protein JEZ03_02000 [Bacteroidales bacterium]|nr:hypothetical protein [Bacteroidales bacterium]